MPNGTMKVALITGVWKKNSRIGKKTLAFLGNSQSVTHVPGIIFTFRFVSLFHLYGQAMGDLCDTIKRKFKNEQRKR